MFACFFVFVVSLQRGLGAVRREPAYGRPQNRIFHLALVDGVSAQELQEVMGGRHRRFALRARAARVRCRRKREL